MADSRVCNANKIQTRNVSSAGYGISEPQKHGEGRLSDRSELTFLGRRQTSTFALPSFARDEMGSQKKNRPRIFFVEREMLTTRVGTRKIKGVVTLFSSKVDVQWLLTLNSPHIFSLPCDLIIDTFINHRRTRGRPPLWYLVLFEKLPITV